MEISNFTHKAQSFDGILGKTGADQQNIKPRPIERQNNLFRSRRRHRVEAFAAQQCIHQELAAHGDRICDQDSGPEIRIGDGFQAKLNAPFKWGKELANFTRKRAKSTRSPPTLVPAHFAPGYWRIGLIAVESTGTRSSEFNAAASAHVPEPETLGSITFILLFTRWSFGQSVRESLSFGCSPSEDSRFLTTSSVVLNHKHWLGDQRLLSAGLCHSRQVKR